jgi:DNA-directed RNA polymerase specialized sigma24 family protein
MTKRVTKSADFKAEVLPNIEPLLQVSLWLTRNGLDANRLMREALTEAYRSWNQSVPEGCLDTWLREILISRFFAGDQQAVRLTVPDFCDIGEIFSGVCPNASPAPTGERQQSRPTTDPAGDSHYFEAIAGLPAVCRSAMILSYLEGVSNKGTADVGGAQPQAIEPVLSPARSFIREELFEHLMDSTCPDGGAGWDAAADQINPDVQLEILNLNANIDSHTQRSSHD